MTDHQPEVLLQPDGTILVWLQPDSDEAIQMTQRQWAMLTIAVDTELTMRKMDQSELIGSGEMVQLDPDWVEHASILAYERERMAEERNWWNEQYDGPMRGVAQAWPEGQGIGEPVSFRFETVDGECRVLS